LSIWETSAFLDHDGDVQAYRLKTQLISAGERDKSFVTVAVCRRCRRW
jgi:hypothetical protein